MVRAAWRFRARGWYGRPPFLPLPPADYVAWRLHTAYGDEDAVPPEHELGRYLDWSARFGQGARQGRLPASPHGAAGGRSSVARRDRQGS